MAVNGKKLSELTDKVSDIQGTERIYVSDGSGTPKYIETNQLATKTELSGKVDKDGTKVLSEKNFTAAYETKLKGIAANANNYTLPAATGSALGGVKQAALVAEAVGENVTKAEFKALLDALKAAGIMANS